MKSKDKEIDYDSRIIDTYGKISDVLNSDPKKNKKKKSK